MITLDSIDDMCWKEGIYQYNEKLRQFYLPKEILKLLIADRKGQICIFWPNNHIVTKILYEMNAEENDMITMKAPDIFRGKGKYQKKYFLLCTYVRKKKRKIRKAILRGLYQCEIIDFYDILEAKGIIYDKDFFLGKGVTYADIVRDLNIYEGIENKEEKYIAIKRIIGDYLAIKDFQNAFLYINKLKEIKPTEYRRYLALKDKIENKLLELEKKVEKKEHIILNWIDGLRYDEAKNMNFLSRQAEQGINFENMFAATSYTNAAMKTLFTGKLLIDDKLYKMKVEECEKGRLYQILEKREYKFVYIGGKFNKGIFYDSIVNCLIKIYKEREEVPSTVWQYVLIHILAKSDKKYFAIVHNLCETHTPNMNPIQINAKKITDNDIINFQFNSQETIKEQIRLSQKYIDEQLEFYERFYKKALYKIYMSDHGQCRYERPICFEGLHKVFMCVSGKGILPEKHIPITSSLAFPDMIEHLLDHRAYALTKVYGKEYALVQQDDIYGKSRIKEYLNSPAGYKTFFLQHRGIITDKDFYVKYITGEEHYWRIDEKENLIKKEEYQNRIAELKKLAGNHFINIQKEDKYISTRKLYRKLNYKVDVGIKFIE